VSEFPEDQIPVHMNVAKAMFLEHARMQGLSPETSEAAWMLEADVRHYWTHLSIAAINELSDTRDRGVGSTMWALAQYADAHPDDPVVLAVGTKDEAAAYGAILIEANPTEDPLLFVIELGSNGKPMNEEDQS